MKQTFYLYQYSSGDIFLSQKETNVALPIFGTIELDVQPIKKEVEKVIKPSITYWPDSVRFNSSLPLGAYDVKVSYKIKE